MERNTTVWSLAYAAATRDAKMNTLNATTWIGLADAVLTTSSNNSVVGKGAGITTETGLIGSRDDHGEPTFFFLVTTIAIALLSFGGNILVCFLFSRSRNLRRRANTFVVSLALSDVLVAALYVPAYVYDTINQQNTHIRFVVLFITLSSILNHCALTYDRFVCIKKPLHYHRVMTNRRVRLILVAVWLLPVVNAVTPATWIFNDNLTQYKKMTMVKYFVLVNIIFIFLCTMLIFGVYGFLFRVARRHIIAISKMTAGDLTPTNADRNRLQAPGQPRRRKRTSKVWFAELRTARTFLIIVSFHFVCWLPMVFINLSVIFIPPTRVQLLRDLLPVEIHFIMFYGLLTRSCINPFLYALFKVEFRVAIRRLIFKRATSYSMSMTRTSRWDRGTSSSRKDSSLLPETSN